MIINLVALIENYLQFVIEQVEGQQTFVEPNHFPLTIDGVVLWGQADIFLVSEEGNLG